VRSLYCSTTVQNRRGYTSTCWGRSHPPSLLVVVQGRHCLRHFAFHHWGHSEICSHRADHPRYGPLAPWTPHTGCPSAAVMPALLCHCTACCGLARPHSFVSLCMSLCNRAPVSPCHCVTVSLCHCVTVSLCHCVTVSRRSDCVLGGMTSFLFFNVAISGMRILTMEGGINRRNPIHRRHVHHPGRGRRLCARVLQHCGAIQLPPRGLVLAHRPHLEQWVCRSVQRVQYVQCSTVECSTLLYCTDVAMSQSHCVTVSLCHCVTVSSCHCVAVSLPPLPAALCAPCRVPRRRHHRVHQRVLPGGSHCHDAQPSSCPLRPMTRTSSALSTFTPST